MSATFHLSILTPEKSVFEGPVEYVEVPGIAGYLGVLAHHAALVTGLASGTLTVRVAGGQTQRWELRGGFEVSNNRSPAPATPEVSVPRISRWRPLPYRRTLLAMSWRVPISAGLLRRAAVAAALGGLCAAAPASAAQDVTSPGARHVPAASDTAIVPFGARPRIDGKLGEREWADADTFRIQAGARRVVPVLLKHDGRALYVAFTNLPPGKHEEQYPEVLIDASGDGGERWGLDDLWLHASYSNCDARGGFDVYGWAACGDRYGWSANRFPVPGGVIEFRVDLDFVGFAASSPGRWFGLALEVTDGSGVRAFWPATSDMLRPGTWARARLTARSARPGR